ncbi:MAG: c-type cytochrome [Betaproteobacteria bacterium]
MKGTLLAAAMIVALGFLGTAVAGGDAQAGKVKAGACAGCHGANGEGNGPNPALAGLKEAAFVQAMKDYKSGKRANPGMKNFAAPLSDQDTANLAAFYASLKKK